jgi:magnesium transporter
MPIICRQSKAPEVANIGIENIQSLDNIWIDILNFTKDEETAIETRFGIDLISETQMRNLEDSSRFYQEDGNLYLGISIPARLENIPLGQLGHKRSYLGFVLTPRTLLTFHEAQLRALEVGKSRANTRINGARNSNDVLLLILEAIIERQSEILARIGIELDGVSLPAIAEKRIIKAEQRLRKLGAMGAAIALSRDCLSDLVRAINFLIANIGVHNIDGKKLRGFLQDLSTLQRQSEAQSSDLTFLLDATLGLVGARQSSALNFMAVVTLLFAPATLISSIFGMNFGHWQFLESANGLLISLGAMGLSAILVLAIAKYAKLF